MHDLRYSQGKLWGLTIMMALTVVVMLALFTHPDFYVPGRFGILFNGDLGHFVTLPIVVIACAVVAVRAAMLAVGTVEALTVHDKGLIVTTMWRSRKVAWGELMQVRLGQTEIRGATVYTLKVDRRDGGSLSLPLGTTELHPDHYYDYVMQLSELHLERVRNPVARRVETPVAVPEPQAPQRPVFGRKAA